MTFLNHFLSQSLHTNTNCMSLLSNPKNSLQIRCPQFLRVTRNLSVKWWLAPHSLRREKVTVGFPPFFLEICKNRAPAVGFLSEFHWGFHTSRAVKLLLRAPKSLCKDVGQCGSLGWVDAGQTPVHPQKSREKQHRANSLAPRVSIN